MKQFLWTALVGVAVVLVLETDVNAEVINEEAEAGARKALEYFMEKWNTGDDEKLRTAMHFPFITFGGGKNVFVKENPEDFSQHFDRMKENDGWASSSFDYDTLKFYMSTEDKVHLSIDYNRFKADGEKYGTGNVFYVVIKKDGRWGMQLRSGGQSEAPSEDRDAIVTEAREAVVGYMKEFNASDADGTASHLNFPHFFMINGGVMLAENPEGRSAKPNFDRMRDSENWFFSTFDSLEASIVAPNKVHWELVFIRCHPDGTQYWTVPAVWVTTKVDGKWGIQYRSLMKATNDSR